jgi:UDPglucose 6-dehydrogenase
MPKTADLRICVCGLGHLGTVTAAALSEHFTTVAYDPDPAVIAALRAGRAPISEPGLDDVLKAGAASKRLTFTDDAAALRDADLVWFTFETPVDENDVGDVDFVEVRIRALLPHVPNGALVLVSSQVPVGFTARCEAAFRKDRPADAVEFAYSPENLQLGRALDAFRKPERIVVGTRGEAARARLAPYLAPFSPRLEWMSIESAEMTKHALNSFLATSVAFINELSELCEKVGADPKEVERGLKSEPRVGAKAYLRPGSAFSGGTLARDVSYLIALGERANRPTRLFPAVLASNEAHKGWARRKLIELIGDVSGKTVAVWGLSYKPGTDSIRRSAAVELCRWLVASGARVQAFDPAVKSPPDGFDGKLRLCANAADALLQADALVAATEWPEFKLVPADAVTRMNAPVVVDAGGFLGATLGRVPRVRYAAVGAA